MTVRKLPSGLYEATIQGATKPMVFEFQKWGAEEATETLLDLIAIGGEAAGSLLSVISGGGLDKDLSSSPIETLFRQLSLGLTRDRKLTKRLIMKLSADRVICNGVTVRYEDLYGDDLALSFKAAKANLEVQYGNFLDAAKSMGLFAQTPAAKDEAESPK